MLKFSVSRATIVFISAILALFGVACSNSTQTTAARNSAQPAARAIPSAALDSPEAVEPSIRSVPEAVKSDSNQPNYYEMALDKAYSALSISQSARSSADWNLVLVQWKDAIALLEAVPETSPDQGLAHTKIVEYQHQLTYAQQQATRLNNHPNSVVTFVPPTPASTRSLPRPEVELASPSPPVFEVPIKRHSGGTPVINVTFNGTQQVEMIVDTGASGTVITQQAAAALGVVAVTKAKANTASAKAVEFPVGYVNSISVGGVVAKHLPVAIAPSAELEVGLLGHDFFGNYDVTIKRNVVEFRPQ